jgi:hypothetical protein
MRRNNSGSIGLSRNALVERLAFTASVTDIILDTPVGI